MKTILFCSMIILLGLTACSLESHTIVSDKVAVLEDSENIPASGEVKKGMMEYDVKAFKETDSKEETPVPIFKPTPYKAKIEIEGSSGIVWDLPSILFNQIATVDRLTKLNVSEKAVIDGETWYHVQLDKKDGWVNEINVKVTSVLLDAPLIAQMPELQRGCEVTTLAMLLNYAGVDVGKMELADKIKKVPFKENGYRGNLNEGFVGDIYTFKKSGIGVYHGPVADLAEKYLPGKIVDLTGKGFDSVLQYVEEGKPVWVINNSHFNVLPDSQWATWKTKSGNIKVTYREHCVLVTGFDEQYVYFNDPLSEQKNRKILKDNFIAAWEQIGSQAISYD